MRIAEYKFMAEEISGDKINLPNMDVYSFCLEIFENTDSYTLRKHFRNSLKNIGLMILASLIRYLDH